jgi:hypothetical protein
MSIMFVFYTGNLFSLSKKLVAPAISDMNFTQLNIIISAVLRIN